jgi:hypothetical protein
MRPLKTAAAFGGALTVLALPPVVAQAATNSSNPLGQPKALAAPDPDCSKSGTITWQDRYDNRYMEVYHSGKANGNFVDAYTGNGTCTQHWYAVFSGTHSADGHEEYYMINANSGKCLWAVPGDIGNTHIEQYTCYQSPYGGTLLWIEHSVAGGWVLGETPNKPYFGDGPMACEDIDNHWLYTSYIQNYPSGFPSNCIWH